MHKTLTLVLAAGLFAALPPTHSQNTRTGRDVGGLTQAIEAARPDRQLAPKQAGCVEHVISCGQTVSSNIAADDCRAEGDILFDVWFFGANAGQTITATMSSNAFNPFLLLFDPDVNFVAEDDDSGPGDAARIVFQIDRTSNDWSLAATPLEANVTGPYTLTLQCSGGGPPPPQCPTGFFPDPEYPDFCFDVAITPSGQAPIDGSREADCIEDTVCVSGALPGRSEVFLRILGPRPNGFLWPTITRFTPSRVDVEMFQLSSGESQSYTLPAVPPGSDDLSGLQDRTGFLP
ncbi:MAG TPA: hypothetical protein VLF66_13175 [Thermoanaerobaculia bacterium]|nr:hypothetical protein [Thermoanaerobaculia bacterium]